MRKVLVVVGVLLLVPATAEARNIGGARATMGADQAAYELAQELGDDQVVDYVAGPCVPISRSAQHCSVRVTLASGTRCYYPITVRYAHESGNATKWTRAGGRTCRG